ncbi:NO-inducible flavohemoprotein [Diaphorobacter ruginosibacter]|uniref:nitric oxide dioxygenase n=1 Tax=Diaphorobacter ruginosibacter TaxID=1715720 RepID=A0A7G9RPH7_9BURK|nr:NO-inducible flavohemoprotein [Diaphorobacter ruginosibacter]QNN57502.1 NO-inducible flavohemoprotein [Diaphorobacter ruginosibacter]
MLTESQKAIVRSTVPLLETGGEALTTHFYRIMLSEHPEVRPLFNSAHQQTGAQPRALAHSVLMYAKHIDRLEALGDLPAQIINKHVALQVQPGHYPIVGACLLRAIREVLGAEIATDEVIAAWGAAYQQLADILIGAEAQAYDRNAGVPGGWRGERAFIVQMKVEESSEITSFHLVPADGGAVMAHEPGQYLGLRLIIDGEEQRRNYSISAPSNGRSLRISVKREPGGKASNHLHDAVHEGDTLQVFPPAGNFTLRQGDRPLVLISGGVGITPTLPMLQAALQGEREVTFIHCARERGVHAFREQIDTLARQHPQLTRRYCYDRATPADAVDAEGLLTAEQLGEWLPASRDADVYFLGPRGFMRSVKQSLAQLGVPQEQVHYEFFGPAEALA